MYWVLPKIPALIAQGRVHLGHMDLNLWGAKIRNIKTLCLVMGDSRYKQNIAKHSLDDQWIIVQSHSRWADAQARVDIVRQHFLLVKDSGSKENKEK